MRVREEGREWFYALDPVPLAAAYHEWWERYVPLWDERLARLKRNAGAGPQPTALNPCRAPDACLVSNDSHVVLHRATHRPCGKVMRGPTLPDSFVHLHLHTEYSMLDGASRIGEVVAAAAADGQPAVGITDHGNMYGALPLYTAARGRRHQARARHGGLLHQHVALRATQAVRARDLPPHDARRDRTRATATSSRSRAARTSTATTTSRAATGSCSRRHHEGITATTGCLGGLVSQLILQGRASRPRSRPRPRFQDIFGREHFFVELQDHGIDDDATVDPAAARHRAQAAARRCSRRTTATTRTRKTPRRTTRCCACRPARCRATRSGFKFEGDDFYIKSAAEMRDLFREAPDACDNTLLIAERAEVEIEFGKAILPVVPRARRPRRELVPARAHDGGREASATAPTPALARAWSASSTSSTSSSRWGSRRTSSSSGISCATRSRAASASVRGGGARPARASRTACASSTSTRSSTTSCSSGSSTRAASRCPTSTWTSTRATAAR